THRSRWIGLSEDDVKIQKLRAIRSSFVERFRRFLVSIAFGEVDPKTPSCLDENLRSHSVLLAVQRRRKAVRSRKDRVHSATFARRRTHPGCSRRQDRNNNCSSLPDLFDSFSAPFPNIALPRVDQSPRGGGNSGTRMSRFNRIKRSLSAGLENARIGQRARHSGGGVLSFALSRSLPAQHRQIP